MAATGSSAIHEQGRH